MGKFAKGGENGGVLLIEEVDKLSLIGSGGAWGGGDLRRFSKHSCN